jgi:hypothetical protein
MRTVLCPGILAIGASLISAANVFAATVVLTPTHDTYLQGTPTSEQALTHDGMNLALLPLQRTAPTFQFDLSSLAGQTILQASIKVFQFDDTGVGTTFTNTAFFFDYPDGSLGVDETTATWSNGGNRPGESHAEPQTETFGVFNLDANSAAGQYYESAAASVSDLAFIQGRIDKSNAADRFLAMQLYRVGAPPLVGGDFNNDRDVDGDDFTAWQTNFPTASGATRAMGDADADGDVDGADFVAWQTNFPTSAPGRLFGDKETLYPGDNLAHPVQLVLVVPDAAADAVPEAPTFGLAIAGLLALAAGRWSRFFR